MRFKADVIAFSASVFGMILALPLLAGAATAGPLNRSANSVYAQAGETSPASVDDATLRRTAAAYVKVSDIAIKTEQAMNKTDDSAKKEQLAAESESAKVAAVKEEGMEPQQYNSVIQMVKADTNLQQKFLSYVQELRHAS